MNSNFCLTDEQSKRFNILKALFAIFVVFNHSYSTNINFQSGTLSLNEPIWLSTSKYTISSIIALCSNYGFFLMASILLYRKEFTWRNNIKKKIKTLLIPYLIMNTFWILVFYVCQSVPSLSTFFGNQENLVSTYGFIEFIKAYGIGKKYPFLAPTWFIKYLFAFNVLTVIIKKVIDKSPKLVAIVLLVAYIFVPSFSGSFLDTEYICIWAFGYYIVKYNLKINFFDNKKYVYPIYILLITINILFFIGIINNEYLLTSFERLGYIVGVIFWYSKFSKVVYDNKKTKLLNLSKYSFGIYIFHQYGIDFLKKICLKIFPITTTSLLAEYLLLPIIMIYLCVIFCKIFKKVMPKLYSVVLGERG